MKTYLSRFFVAASSVLATALTTTAVAQTVGSRAPRPMVRPNVANLLPLTGAEAKTSPREQAERLAQLRANRPLLFKARIAGQAVAGQLKPVKRAVPAKADALPSMSARLPSPCHSAGNCGQTLCRADVGLTLTLTTVCIRSAYQARWS